MIFQMLLVVLLFVVFSWSIHLVLFNTLLLTISQLEEAPRKPFVFFKLSNLLKNMVKSAQLTGSQVPRQSTQLKLQTISNLLTKIPAAKLIYFLPCFQTSMHLHSIRQIKPSLTLVLYTLQKAQKWLANYLMKMFQSNQESCIWGYQGCTIENRTFPGWRIES